MQVRQFGIAIIAVGLVGLFFPAPEVSLGQAPKKSKFPPPEDVTLETSDGVSVRATWYAGLGKKESVPVIMIHGWEGARGEYDGLAKALQTLGHSTIVPDLRGHGESKTIKFPNGDSKTIEHEKLRPRDMESMTLDIEACKKFLVAKNNAGECNIEMLCLIGADFGSILALQYAALDWSVPNLPAFKQGQDVKGVVLLSPVQSQKGLTVRDALAHQAVRSRLSIMFVAGKQDSKGTSEAKRLYNSLQTHHPKIKEDESIEEKKKKQELFLVQPETSLTGTKLLRSDTRVPQNIATFLEWRLTSRKGEFPWSERQNPLGN